jgi:hypothetical protein
MARPPEFVPNVRVDINFKRSHVNDRRYVYGRPKHNQKTLLKVQYFTGTKNGRSVGTEVEFQIVFDYDPREKLRAWIGIGQLRALPYFVKERLAAGGIDLCTTRRKRFPVYRITGALWKLAVLDADTDIHHENNNCLDDRAQNLTPLHRLQHAQHHINVRKEKTNKVNRTGGFKGFFDFRRLKERQEEVTANIQAENQRRKELGLEPITRTTGVNDRAARQQMMLSLHRECCRELGVK